VILSTHDPDHAFRCAQRVVILHDGRLAYIGAPREVLTPGILRTVYGVDVEITEIESGAGDKHLICLPSLARFRSTTVQRTLED
jgi:iron complex transport system ATP-binding protein